MSKISSKPNKLTQKEELQILRQIVDVANSELDLKHILKDIVGIVSNVTGADSVFIYLYCKYSR